MSLKTRMEGSGGKSHSFWAMYSLRMSFWLVPPRASGGTPCFSAATTYIARSTIAGALMVMEVVISPIGMPPKSRSMSSRESTAAPPVHVRVDASRVGILAWVTQSLVVGALDVIGGVEGLYRNAGHRGELGVA